MFSWEDLTFCRVQWWAESNQMLASECSRNLWWNQQNEFSHSSFDMHFFQRNGKLNVVCLCNANSLLSPTEMKTSDSSAVLLFCCRVAGGTPFQAAVPQTFLCSKSTGERISWVLYTLCQHCFMRQLFSITGAVNSVLLRGNNSPQGVVRSQQPWPPLNEHCLRAEHSPVKNITRITIVVFLGSVLASLSNCFFSSVTNECDQTGHRFVFH